MINMHAAFDEHSKMQLLQLIALCGIIVLQVIHTVVLLTLRGHKE